MRQWSFALIIKSFDSQIQERKWEFSLLIVAKLSGFCSVLISISRDEVVHLLEFCDLLKFFGLLHSISVHLGLVARTILGHSAWQYRKQWKCTAAYIQWWKYLVKRWRLQSRVQKKWRANLLFWLHHEIFSSDGRVINMFTKFHACLHSNIIRNFSFAVIISERVRTVHWVALKVVWSLNV